MSHLPASKTLRGHSEHAFFAALTPDGAKCVTTSLDGNAYIHYTDGTPRPNVIYSAHAEGHSGAAHGASLSADGMLAASTGMDGAVRLWSAATSRTLFSISIPNASYSADVSLTPDGTRMVSSFVTDTYGLPPVATFIVYDTTGAKVVVIPEWKSSARDLSRTEQAPAARPHAPVEVAAWTAVVGTHAGVAIIDDGSVVAAVEADAVRVVDADSCTPLGKWTTRGDAHVALDAAAECVAIADSGSLRVGAIAGGELVALSGYKAPLNPYVALSANGARVVAGVEGYAFCVWDVATGVIEATLDGAKDEVRGVAVSADGAVIVGCSYDGTARVWRLPPCTPERPPSVGDWMPAARRLALRRAFWNAVVNAGRERDLLHCQAVLTLRQVGGGEDGVVGEGVSGDNALTAVVAELDGKRRNSVDEESFLQCVVQMEERDSEKKRAERKELMEEAFQMAAGDMEGFVTVPVAAAMIGETMAGSQEVAQRALEQLIEGNAVDFKAFRAAAEIASS